MVAEVDKKIEKREFQELVYLTPKLKEQLRTKAFEQNISKSAIVREALRLYFRGKNNPSEKDKIFDQTLADCTDFFGGFTTTNVMDDDGFFYLAKKRGIKLKNLSDTQLKTLTDKLIIGYKGFLLRPSVDEFMEYVNTLEPTPEYAQKLRTELEEKEEN